MPTGDAYSSGHQVPSHLGLAYVLLVETNPYHVPAVLFPDYALRTSLGTISILFFTLWCHGDSASVLLYFTFLSDLFPLQCGSGSTVTREGFDSSVIMPFFLVCCGCDTSYIVSVHIQCQASICTLSLCRRHSWRVRLTKQETVTPPGHLISSLVCRGQ